MDYSLPALTAVSDFLIAQGYDADALMPRLELLYDCLLQANQTMNLTRITDKDEFFRKHILDSLSVLPALPAGAHSLLDLGTGGGVPGLPLWLVRPEIELTLLDSVGKKLRACEGMIDQLIERFPELKAQRPCTLHIRAEDAGQDVRYRQNFDVVICRAVASLPILVEWGTPLVKRKGIFIAMKGPQYESEMQGMGQICGLLGTRIDRIDAFDLMGEQRHLLIFEKRSLTPKTLPRPPGQAKKKPLTEFLLNA